MRKRNNKLRSTFWLILSLAPASLVAQPLSGSGDHLPLPVSNPGVPDRVSPAYVDDPSGTFAAEWSSPAAPEWLGTFEGDGTHPGISGPGLANFNFAVLTNGSLPAETIAVLGDLDAGSGPGEAITLKAFDADGSPLIHWLDEPFAASPGTTPMQTPAWVWSDADQSYTFRGNTVPGNPSIGVYLRTNQEIHALEASLASIGFGYAIAAPMTVPVALESFSIE